MLKYLLPCFLFVSLHVKSQQIDSIYVNLYTDSLKKGTYNYINIDGKLHNGRYLPLDSTHLRFSSSAGTFYGNSLYIPADFSGEQVDIHVILKSSGIQKNFSMHIKKNPNPDRLPTEEEILRSRNPSRNKKSRHR